jgi:hypothetical protein
VCAPTLAALALLLTCANGVFAQSTAATSSYSAPRALQVGTCKGKVGSYHTIQDAVNAARPGDWILVAPGPYHEQGGASPTALARPVGVLITTPWIHLRGMDRNTVVVDGTNANPATCSSQPSDQITATTGRNGIEVYKVNGVYIENLTVCNFLDNGFGNNGNQVWWNGGDGSGQIGMGSYWGSYLTASSTFYGVPTTPNVAQYGIFASNAKGPASITHSYASNMADSGFYVGACPDCNTILSYVHAQNNVQGFSGTNSGGHLVLQYSEWDHNQTGILPSTLAAFDLPSPQNGACPQDPDSSCTLIQFNNVHDNNNPNVPAVPGSLQATAPVGTGIDISGGRNNTVQYNLITHNGSWGILNDYADYVTLGTPPPPGYCQGGKQQFTPESPYDQLYSPLPIPCYFRSFGNTVANNVFYDNGFFKNETNGDLANAAIPFAKNNCFHNNIDLIKGEPTSSPDDLQDPMLPAPAALRGNRTRHRRWI